MMVKPEGADEGEAKPLEPPPVNTADDPEGRTRRRWTPCSAWAAISPARHPRPRIATATPARTPPRRAPSSASRARKRTHLPARTPPRDPRPGARTPPPLPSSARPQPPSGYPPPPAPSAPRFAPILAPSLRSSSLVSPAAVPITSPRDPRSKPRKIPPLKPRIPTTWTSPRRC